MDILTELRNLCQIDGVSGDESAVCEYICKRLEGKCDYQVDPLGSILAFKKGKHPAAHKLMISAHMDEVGLIITYINEDGTLKFDCVGGIDTRVLYGRRVRINGSISGVIGGRAVHNLSAEQKERAPKLSDMAIDIGCSSREEAQSLVSLGDCAAFEPQFLQFGEGMVKCKAIDDRVGCAIMLALIDSEPEYDTHFAFVVQEEVGLRGAAAAAFTLAPDFAMVLEATTAADIPSSQGDKRVCEVGGGAVVSFMDRHTIYDRELYRLAFDTAAELYIPCQTKTAVAGGNDAGAISVSGSGVRTMALSLPCRYLHSPSCVIAEEDLQNTYLLAREMIRRIQSL